MVFVSSIQVFHLSHVEQCSSVDFPFFFSFAKCVMQPEFLYAAQFKLFKSIFTHSHISIHSCVSVSAVIRYADSLWMSQYDAINDYIAP